MQNQLKMILGASGALWTCKLVAEPQKVSTPYAFGSHLGSTWSISVACGNFPPRASTDENLALCKGRVPSISLQVLCGSGCVKSKKFKKKLKKT